MNLVIAVRILLALAFVILWIAFGVLFGLKLGSVKLPRREDLQWPTIRKRFFGETARTVEFKILILMFIVGILMALSLLLDSGIGQSYH